MWKRRRYSFQYDRLYFTRWLFKRRLEANDKMNQWWRSHSTFARFKIEKFIYLSTTREGKNNKIQARDYCNRCGWVSSRDVGRFSSEIMDRVYVRLKGSLSRVRMFIIGNTFVLREREGKFVMRRIPRQMFEWLATENENVSFVDAIGRQSLPSKYCFMKKSFCFPPTIAEENNFNLHN